MSNDKEVVGDKEVFAGELKASAMLCRYKRQARASMDQG
jgi:hypothetical protein